MGTLIISCISLFFLWEYIFKRFSLSEELLFPIIIFIFLRTVYILLRKTFYGVDLVKQYTLNEILSAIVMLLMIVYVCIYNWPKLPNPYIFDQLFMFFNAWSKHVDKKLEKNHKKNGYGS